MIYLDNAATTRLTEPVLAAMMPWLTEQYANPAGSYGFARQARDGVKQARVRCAGLIGAAPEEICFTGGGTESDNWALRGAIRLTGKRRIITTRIEHHAVLHTCEYLERQGIEVVRLDVDRDGILSPEAVERAISPDTALVSVMAANNEIGTIQPIREIGTLCRKHGVLFHTDAVQAYGHIPLDVEEMQIDLLSASAHKLHGPKGVGLLYIRRCVDLPPLLFGGGQEDGKRSGTLNTAGIVGFGAAAAQAREHLEENMQSIAALRDEMIRRVLAEIPGTSLTGDPVRRLPGNIHLRFENVKGRELLHLLDRCGICASTGSACSAESMEPSHVLSALGLSRLEADSSLRLTLSEETTREELSRTLDALKQAVDALSWL